MLSGTSTKMSAFQMWKWNQRTKWNNMKRNYREIISHLELWAQPLRRIEGKHGTAVLSYFVFLKWLLYLNVSIFWLIFVFIVIPQLAFRSKITPDSHEDNTTKKCSALYSVNSSHDTLPRILDFIQGTGWMEQTLMFYGSYNDSTLYIYNTSFVYNTPLSYLMVMVSSFFISVLLMVRSMSETFRRSIVNSDKEKTKWTSTVLCGWDHSINDQFAAKIKKKNIYHEIMVELNEERFELMRLARTQFEKFVLYSTRTSINLAILAVLTACGYLLYYVTTFSTERVNSPNFQTEYHEMERLLIEYLPSIAITGLTGTIPRIFQKLVTLENYRPLYAINLTLLRTVFLKLASLAVITATLFMQISCHNKDECRVGVGDCQSFRCWETYLGQNYYRLVVTDFVVSLVTVLVTEVTRVLIVKYFKYRLCVFIGYQQFDIPKNVLDLVYSQTLCWLCVFFAPMVIAMCVLKLVFLFYLKMFSSLFLCVPADKQYKASKTNSFFIIILFVAFFLVCIPIAWTLTDLPPSRGCGPFRKYETIHLVFEHMVKNFPDTVRGIWAVVMSASVIVPVIIALCLAIYYYSVLNKANRDLVRLLQRQLISETRYKKHLFKIEDRHLTPIKQTVDNTNNSVTEDIAFQNHHRNLLAQPIVEES